MVSVDCKTKLQHMSRMFQMYSDGEFTTGCDIWLTGICRYLSEAYSSLSVQMLSLLQTVNYNDCDLILILFFYTL